MEQLLKLISKIFYTATAIVICIACISCKSQHTRTSDKLVVGDSLNKSGFILYDNKNVRAYFFEEGSIPKAPSREIINHLIKDSKIIILLRDGLRNKNESDYLSLTLCSTDKRFIIDKEKLLFNRYSLISVDNYKFYQVNRQYSDNRKRYVFCKHD
jgi:hypothetical protein